MTETLVAILIFSFVILLIIVMFFALKRTIIKINKQSKDYFLDKLQVYDDLIEEKEKKLKELNDKINDSENELTNTNNKNNTNNNVVFVGNEKNIDYVDEDIFNKMHEIDKKFNYNYNNILDKFIKENFKDDNNSKYKKLIKIRNNFDDQTIFELSSMQDEEVQEEIKNRLQDDISIFDDFMKVNDTIDVQTFVSYLDSIISKYDPYIYVYIPDTEKISTDNSYVKVQIDNSIYKGMNIVYKGKLYDYSLK